MSEALKIPHFGYKDEIDMSQLVKLRKDLKASCEERGVKLSYMPFIIKACSMALSHFPILNSTYNVDAGTITYKVRRFSKKEVLRGGYEVGTFMNWKEADTLATFLNKNYYLIYDCHSLVSNLGCFLSTFHSLHPRVLLE